MDKKQAEELINSAFTVLIEKVRAQDEYDPKTVIDDLHKLAQALQADKSVSLNLHTSEQSYEHEYKAIAEESLTSYAQTKDSVEQITKEQQQLIEDSANLEAKKIEAIIHEFESIHGKISVQMTKANNTIKTLHQQINVLEQNSNLDPLTRTLNRRALDFYLGSICEMQNKNLHTHILLIDIDDFKVVNDTYGHLAGDRVLIFLSKLISNSLRDGDKLFRFGGEEFIIILNRADQLACEKIAERIMKGVRSNTLLYKQHQIKITLSIGSTKYQLGDTFESFVERADEALYKAKNNGKDQLVVG